MVLANHGFLLFFLWPGRLAWEGAPAFLSTLSVLAIEWLFVLSGFLIGAMLIRGLDAGTSLRTALGSFWLRRWIRTLPNYYLFLAVNVVLVHLGVMAGQFTWHFLVFAQNLVQPLALPAFFAESWSLALDEWFYLLLPALVAIGVVAGRSRRGSFVAATVLLIAVPTVLRLAVEPAADGFAWDHRIRTVSLFHLDATGWGVLAAVASRWRPAWWRQHQQAKASLGLACLLAGVAMLEAFTFAPEWPQRLPRLWTALPLSLTGLGTFLVVPALCNLPSPRKGLVEGIQRASDWTYSIYLSHMPLGFLVRFWLPGPAQATAVAAHVLLWLALTITVSALTFRFFERPITGLRERFTRRVPAGPFSNPAPPP